MTIAVDVEPLYHAPPWNRLFYGRKAEAELRRLNDSLEQRIAAAVGERMKSEAALRQAQKMDANRADDVDHLKAQLSQLPTSAD